MATKKSPHTFTATATGTLSVSGRRADAYRMTLARTRPLELVLADEIRHVVRETLGVDVVLTLTAPRATATEATS